MGKKILIKDRSNDRDDRFQLETKIGNSGTELTVATLTEAKAGTSATALTTAAGVAALVAAPMSASYSIGTEGTNAITVTIQLKDAAGSDMAVCAGVFAYISDNADGSSITATAPDGGWAIATDGLLIPVIAGKAAYLVSEADGDIAVTITESAGKDCYMVIVLPTGKLAISGKIAFAA